MPRFNESSALLFTRSVEAGIESPAELANEEWCQGQFHGHARRALRPPRRHVATAPRTATAVATTPHSNQTRSAKPAPRAR